MNCTLLLITQPQGWLLQWSLNPCQRYTHLNAKLWYVTASLSHVCQTQTHTAQFADGYSRTLHRATPTVDASGEKPSYWMPPGSPRVATGSSVGGAASVTRPASPSSNSRHRDKRVPMNSKMYHKQTQADQYMLACLPTPPQSCQGGWFLTAQSRRIRNISSWSRVRGTECTHNPQMQHHTRSTTPTHRPHRWRY